MPTRDRRLGLKRPQWFPMDAVAWMLSHATRSMPWNVVGMYHWLLCVQWERGFLPANLDDVHRCLRREGAKLREPFFREAWERHLARHFPPSPTDAGRLENPKLAALRARAVAGERVEEGFDPDAGVSWAPPAATESGSSPDRTTAETGTNHDRNTPESGVNGDRITSESDANHSESQHQGQQRGEERKGEDGKKAARKAGAEAFDFEALYARYPRRKGDPGKKRGLDRCRSQIKTQVQYDRLGAAIDAYAVSRRDEDPVYTKQFSTFMGCWEDYAPAGGAALSLVGAPKPGEVLLAPDGQPYPRELFPPDLPMAEAREALRKAKLTDPQAFVADERGQPTDQPRRELFAA
jgi:hypothetical protein